MGRGSRMKGKNKERNYLRICRESGCMTANYNIEDLDENSVVVPYDADERSGRFKAPSKRGRFENEVNDRGSFE